MRRGTSRGAQSRSGGGGVLAGQVKVLCGSRSGRQVAEGELAAGPYVELTS